MESKLPNSETDNGPEVNGGGGSGELAWPGGGGEGRAARWVAVSWGTRKGRALFLQKEWGVGGTNCFVTNWHH